jgi:hypothetical protein
MSLTEPPPEQVPQVRWRGSGPNRRLYNPLTSRIRLIKVSDANKSARESTLLDLKELWANGLPNKTGPSIRWAVVKRLRAMRLITAHPNAPHPASLSNLYADGRLSTAGWHTWSGECYANKIHIDGDWFGPSRQAGVLSGPNWWDADVDGPAAERHVTEKLLHYLEASLGLAPSGVETDEWTWPAGYAPLNQVAALVSAEAEVTVLTAQPASGFNDIRLEWHVGNSFAPNRPTDITCSTTGHTFMIETPDVVGNPRYVRNP